jgi:hypothetical protein
MTIEPRQKPGEWLEYSPVLIILVGALLAWYLVDVFQKSPTGPLAALDLNTYNLIFITVGMFLHWRVQAIPPGGGPVGTRRRRRAHPVSLLRCDLRDVPVPLC